MDFWRDSQSRFKSPLARERHRKRFMAYAKDAIRLAGVDAVAKVNNDREWESMIREPAARGKWRRKGLTLDCRVESQFVLSPRFLVSRLARRSSAHTRKRARFGSSTGFNIQYSNSCRSTS